MKLTIGSSPGYLLEVPVSRPTGQGGADALNFYTANLGDNLGESVFDLDYAGRSNTWGI